MEIERWGPLQLPGDCRLEMHSGNGLTALTGGTVTVHRKYLTNTYSYGLFTAMSVEYFDPALPTNLDCFLPDHYQYQHST